MWSEAEDDRDAASERQQKEPGRSRVSIALLEVVLHRACMFLHRRRGTRFTCRSQAVLRRHPRSGSRDEEAACSDSSSER